MKFLYKYPQAEYPYGRLVEENRAARRRAASSSSCSTPASSTRTATSTSSSSTPRRRPKTSASASRRSTAGPSRRRCTSCRTCGSATPGRWGADAAARAGDQPRARRARASVSLRRRRLGRRAAAEPIPFDYRLGPRHLYAPPGGEPLFTDNETNSRASTARARRAASRYVKDAFHRHIIDGEDVRQPGRRSAPRRRSTTTSTPSPPGGSVGAAPAADRPRRRCTIRSPRSTRSSPARSAEADEFYEAIHPPKATADEKLVQRQALAGLLWTKQIYLFDVDAGSTATTPTCRRRSRARRSATTTGGT